MTRTLGTLSKMVDKLGITFWTWRVTLNAWSPMLWS